MKSLREAGQRRLIYYLLLPVILGTVFVVHFSSGNIGSGDSMWFAPTSFSMIREGNTDLDDYVELIQEKDYYLVVRAKRKPWLVQLAGVPLSPYYLPQRIGLNSRLLEALTGNLISPARGLFVFTPVFLFSLVGLVIKARSRTFMPLDCVLGSAVVLHWVSISLFPHWWGGHPFGPKFFTGLTPYLVYYLVPVVQRMTEWRGWRKALIVCVFVSCVTASCFVHCRGATRWETWLWNTDPVDVDVGPARLWDWRDVQFLRGIGRCRGRGA